MTRHRHTCRGLRGTTAIVGVSGGAPHEQLGTFPQDAVFGVDGVECGR
jgi:hypothetical protein